MEHDRWPLPKLSALRHLPEEIIEEVREHAARRIHRLVFPLFRIYQKRRNEEKLTNHRFSSKELSTAALCKRIRELELFKKWPDTMIAMIAASGRRRSYEAGSILTYAGTPFLGANVIIVVQGQVARTVNLQSGVAINTNPFKVTSTAIVASNIFRRGSASSMRRGSDVGLQRSYGSMEAPRSILMGSGMGNPGPGSPQQQYAGGEILSSPQVFNFLASISETVSLQTVRSQTIVDCLYIPSPGFLEICETHLAAPILKEIRSMAFSDRKITFQNRVTFPEEFLANSLLFSALSKTEIKKVISLFQPFCFHTGETVIKQGNNHVDKLYVVVNGSFVTEGSDLGSISIRHSSPVSREQQGGFPNTRRRSFVAGAGGVSFSASQIEGAPGGKPSRSRKSSMAFSEGGRSQVQGGESDGEEKVKILLPPTPPPALKSTKQVEEVPPPSQLILAEKGTFFNETEVFFNLKYNEKPTAVAAKLTNSFVCSKKELKKLMASDPTLSSKIESTYRTNRAAQMIADVELQKIVLQYVNHLPLFHKVLTEKQRGKLAKQLKPHVLFPREMLCTQAAPCDQLTVIVSGHGRVVSDAAECIMSAGCWVGYPILHQHKWAHSVFAVSPMEVVSISRTDLICFLKAEANAEGKRILQLSSILLFPSKYTLQDSIDLADAMPASQTLETTLPLYAKDTPNESFVPRPPKPPLDDQTKTLISLMTMSKETKGTKKGGPTIISEALIEGKSNVCYRSESKLTGLCGHTCVFQSALWQPPKETSSPQRAQTARTTTPAAASVSATGSPHTVSERGGFKKRELTFVQSRDVTEAQLAYDKTDEFLNSHKAKVDKLWQSLPRKMRSRVQRLYPPARSSHRHSSQSNLVRSNSTVGTGSNSISGSNSFYKEQHQQQSGDASRRNSVASQMSSGKDATQETSSSRTSSMAASHGSSSQQPQSRKNPSPGKTSDQFGKFFGETVQEEYVPARKPKRNKETKAL